MSMEFLGYLVEVLQIWVLEAPIYACLIVFVLGVGIGASLGLYVASGTDQTIVQLLAATVCCSLRGTPSD